MKLFDFLTERPLTKKEKGKKEKYVKGMKSAKGDFEKRYGKDAKSVMYATATKMAKKESLQALARHVKEGVPLPDSLFRYQSEAYFDTFRQAKQLREMGSLPELDWESEEMLSTDIGESVELENGETVWLDVPYLDEGDEPNISDDMIGVPDKYYDEEQRREAYDDLQTALGGVRNDWEKQSVIDGICPECSGTSFMDGDYDNDEDSCYGWGNYGCDGGEMENASWVEIIKFDQQNVDRQKAKDNYPGDDVVIDQVANMVKNMDDPRDAVFQLQADYPHMGKAQRAGIVAKAMKKAGLTEDKLDGYYIAQRAKELWLKDNPDKTERDYWRAGKHVHDEYGQKAGGKIKKQGGLKEPQVWENINEGEERSIIHDATVEKLVDEFSNRVGEMESMEELHDKLYTELEYLDVDEVVDPDMEVGGQRIGDFASGRVIDVISSEGVMDEVTNSLDLSDLEDRDSAFPYQYKESVQEDKDQDSNEAMVSKMLAKALGDENRWSEMTPHELYAELESEKPEVADVIKLTAKMLYDVRLAESKISEAEYNGKKVKLNKPMRSSGGGKKYKVYVKNPKTGRVKKISFGDAGLKTKSGNKKRAKSFAARHNCEKKNDKMKAGYWACRLPRYGLVKGGKWW